MESQCKHRRSCKHYNLYLPSPRYIGMARLLGAAFQRHPLGNRTVEASSLSHPSLEGIYTVHRIHRSDQIVRR